MRRAARAQHPAIGPDELIEWVEAVQTAASPDEGWDGVAVRGYRSLATDADLPPLVDHLLVIYPWRPFLMERHLLGRWTSAPVGPGAVSLLTREAEARWRWEGVIETVNVYLRPEELAQVGEQVHGRDLADVELIEHLDVQDPALHACAAGLLAEALNGGAGTRLLVDSLRTELAVQLLRRHTRIRFREPSEPAGLSFRQERTVKAFIRENLRADLTLDELADAAGLPRFHFTRAFRRATGMTPYAYVLATRVARAQELIDADRPPAQAALESGFTDTEHLAQAFASRVGMTPTAYRERNRF